MATTAEWIHSVVPAPFQQILDSDQNALVPFTDQDTTCKEMLVKVMGKVMKRSEEQSSSNKRSPSGEDTTAEAQTNSSSAADKWCETALQQTTMQELVQAEKKVLEEKLAKLERGEEESQKIVQDTLKLFDEVSSSLLKQLKVSSSNLTAAQQEAESLLKQMSELQQQASDWKKKHYNADRVPVNIVTIEILFFFLFFVGKGALSNFKQWLEKGLTVLLVVRTHIFVFIPQVQEATRAVEERDLALEKAVEERDAALEQQAEAITARDKAVEAAGVAKKEVESSAVKARGFEIDLAEAQRNLELATVSNKEFKKKVTELQFKLELIETERDQFKGHIHFFLRYSCFFYAALAKGARNAMKDLSFSSLSRSPDTLSSITFAIQKQPQKKKAL
eukprot:g38067.t1